MGSEVNGAGIGFGYLIMVVFSSECGDLAFFERMKKRLVVGAL